MLSSAVPGCYTRFVVRWVPRLSQRLQRITDSGKMDWPESITSFHSYLKMRCPCINFYVEDHAWSSNSGVMTYVLSAAHTGAAGVELKCNTYNPGTLEELWWVPAGSPAWKRTRVVEAVNAVKLYHLSFLSAHAGDVGAFGDRRTMQNPPNSLRSFLELAQTV